MKKINEDFLHFLWKNQHLTGVVFTTVGDFSIKVIDPGLSNSDSGPDFFNARIELNGTIWAGNVELHINASDWLKHGHDSDLAYDSVILHVVYFSDCEITRLNGEKIPTVVLRFPIILWESYSELQKNHLWIPCQEKLKNIHSLHIAQWTSSLMISKLQERSENLQKHMDDLHGQWDAILLRILFRTFGLPVNTAPFEMLGLLVPYNLLLRNKNDLYALESILFGQAGFYDTSLSHDKYAEGLKQSFARFGAKLDEKHVPNYLWKFMRMRPSSFPSVRLAQFAALFQQLSPLHEKLLELHQAKDLQKIFRIKASDYWNTHFQLGKESTGSEKYIGKDFISILMINGIAPYLFFFGNVNKQQKYCDYAIALLENIPAENNAILKKWGNFGIQCNNAFESQAILFLYKNYCKHNRCLDCQFGNTLIIDEKIQK